MLEESIRTIQEAEQRAEQDKAACRARIQRMLADAEAQAADLAVQAGDTLRREQASLLAKAEAEAAADREIILQQAAGQCQKGKQSKEFPVHEVPPFTKRSIKS